MSTDMGPNEYISRRKMARKVLQHVDRFSWSVEQGRYILDARGPVVFMRDVINVIEGEDA